MINALPPPPAVPYIAVLSLLLSSVATWLTADYFAVIQARHATQTGDPYGVVMDLAFPNGQATVVAMAGGMPASILAAAGDTSAAKVNPQ